MQYVRLVKNGLCKSAGGVNEYRELSELLKAHLLDRCCRLEKNVPCMP